MHIILNMIIGIGSGKTKDEAIIVVTNGVTFNCRLYLDRVNRVKGMLYLNKISVKYLYYNYDCN